MSEPLRARQSEPEEPRPDLSLHEQVTGAGDRSGPAARTSAWFHRTPPGTVPPAVTPRTPGKAARQLTQDEISYFLARDPDKFAEEDFYRDLRFDMAIDREPELE